MEGSENTEASGTTDQLRPLLSTSRKRVSSYASPPYWQRHRSVSNATQASLERPPPIRLEDNTEPDSKTHGTLWARSVVIEDFAVVSGGHSGIGSYVVWNCTVQTLDGGPMIIRKRYSEFDDLREDLLVAFPHSTETSLPPLPPKSAIYKFRPKFLERRRIGLAYFLNCILLNPEYASSPIVKDFIFGDGNG